MGKKHIRVENPSSINVDKIETAILLVKKDYRVVDMNRAAQKLFGVGDNRRRICVLSSIVSYPDKLQNMIDRAIEHGSVVVEREFELQFDSNYSKVIDCVVSALTVSNSDDASCYVEISDKEFFRQIKDTDELSHQSDIWETIARELGHEIKNPLTGIRGTAQLLSEELKNDKYDDFIKIIVEEVDRLSALSNRMLGGFVSAESIEPVNIHEILDHVHSLVTAEKNFVDSDNPIVSDSLNEGHNLVKSYQPPIFVDGDRNQLTQIFLNLLKNAVQAIDQNGEIIISTRIGLRSAIGGKVYGKVAEIRFIDNGKGVDPKLGNSIFLPLVSDKKGGSGLGLSIAQQLARANGGIISLERNVKRTEFLVRIPIGE